MEQHRPHCGILHYFALKRHTTSWNSKRTIAFYSSVALKLNDDAVGNDQQQHHM